MNLSIYRIDGKSGKDGRIFEFYKADSISAGGRISDGVRDKLAEAIEKHELESGQYICLCIMQNTVQYAYRFEAKRKQVTVEPFNTERY